MIIVSASATISSMPKKSQIAVLSIAQSSLASLLFGAFNLDDFPASIAATGGTSVMR